MYNRVPQPPGRSPPVSMLTHTTLTQITGTYACANGCLLFTRNHPCSPPPAAAAATGPQSQKSWGQLVYNDSEITPCEDILGKI